MAVSDDIYDALNAVEGIDGVFDSKRRDNYVLTRAVLVFSCVSDIPAIPIDGAIIGTEQLWQVSVYVADAAYKETPQSDSIPPLHAARTLKARVVAALHRFESEAIEYCELQVAHSEIYDAEGREYHIPIDFLIYTN
jgi:hypothetical protein